MYYVNNRWLGGMLTNFATIKKSINRLKKIEKMEIDGTFESLTKKEVALLQKEKAKLDKNLAGIKEMKDLPGVIFIIDTNTESAKTNRQAESPTFIIRNASGISPTKSGFLNTIHIGLSPTVVNNMESLKNCDISKVTSSSNWGFTLESPWL